MTKSRNLSRMLLIVFCLSLLLALCFIVAESHHHCTGEHCNICEEINICAGLLHSLFACAGLLRLFLVALIGAGCIRFISFILCFRTLVSYKVKLIN